MDWNEFSQKLNAKMDKTFKPTVEWMTAKYAEMNDQLFNGELGACNFKVFTTGRGAEGGVLGWFKITARGITINRYSRRMSYRIYNGLSLMGGTVTRENFYDVCKPQIELNGNYTGTEHAFLATLVHEMCHYYTYMNGYAPKQGHGREFKEIGYIVSSRSNGMFTIQRLASAEQMSEMELSDEMKAKREKRLANKKASVYAVFDFRKNGEIHLTTTSNRALIDDIVRTYSSPNVIKILLSNDASLIDLLFSKGYRKNMRTWRYWNVQGKDWLNELDNFEMDEYVNPEFEDNTPKKGEVQLGIGNHKNTPPQAPNNPTMVFSIKTSNGVFETECSSFAELRNKLQQRFPNMSYETISKLMGNKANFKKIEENTMSRKDIIKEVIDEFMRNEFRGANNMEDDITINPDMNLGLQSPLETE
jgi:hypothetical protein